MDATVAISCGTRVEKLSNS